MDRHERRNALDGRMIRGILELMRAHGSRPDLRCIVLAARGTAFCGGADLKEMRTGDGEPGIRIYEKLVRALLASPLPVIARVQGPAVAGGVGLVAACHLAVASPEARFFTPEVRSGLYPLMVHALVEHTVGRKRCFAMGLTERSLSATEARELGLVNEVVAPELLDGTIEKWVASMAKIQRDRLVHCMQALSRTQGTQVADRVAELQRALDELSDDLSGGPPPR